jgi:HAD superfamily hydrolase (TIGR01509 family)
LAPLLRALIWDVDGTVAETERDGHRVAFNRAFESLNLPWRWDDAHYGQLLTVAGGFERLLHDMATRPSVPASLLAREMLARELHQRKNAIYADIVAKGGITARPGVQRLMAECEAAGVMLAVATTTSRSNVAALFSGLFGPSWCDRFAAVVCAEEAPQKKPHPQAYLLALHQLAVPAHAAFALEDSPHGLAAARAAGIACGVTRSAYFAGAAFEGAAWVQADLDSPAPVTLAQLRGAAVC